MDLVTILKNCKVPLTNVKATNTTTLGNLIMAQKLLELCHQRKHTLLGKIVTIFGSGKNVIASLQKLSNDTVLSNNVITYYMRLSRKMSLLKRKEALDSYKMGSTHVDVKRFMENGKGNNTVKQNVNRIASTIKAAPVNNKDLIVFRGYKTIQPNGYKKSFTSTSRKASVAYNVVGNNPCCLQVIYVPAHTKFVYFNDKYDEDEILLPPGQFMELYREKIGKYTTVFQLFLA